MNAGCPACEGRLDPWGNAPDKLTGAGEFALSRCRGCSSLVLEPLPTESELSAFYPGDYWYRERDTTWLSRREWGYRRWVLQDHIRFVTRFLPRGSAVLDVGCAGGTFLFLLKQRGYRVQGLDFSQAAATEAADRYGVTVVVGSLREHQEALRQWAPDAVSLFHVLEHLTEPVAELQRVHSVLSSKGQLFLQVPNIESWQAKLFGSRWYGLDVPRHVVNYTRRGLHETLRRSGFRITHYKRFSLRDNSPSWVSSLALGADPLRRRLQGERREGGNLVYAALVAALQPLAALEALCGRGGTLFVRAVKMGENR
jgi:2-polyprenyl-3-methyl-5-hydroxy-6-metoxy-1,4-benzoquinol methylase